MKKTVKTLIGVACAAGLVAASSSAAIAGTAERFKGHMSLLADDLLQGRDTGSIGHCAGG